MIGAAVASYLLATTASDRLVTFWQLKFMRIHNQSNVDESTQLTDYDQISYEGGERSLRETGHVFQQRYWEYDESRRDEKHGDTLSEDRAGKHYTHDMWYCVRNDDQIGNLVCEAILL